MTYDPYTPPVAELTKTPKKSTAEMLTYLAIRTAQGLLIILLVVMWFKHLPHRPISDFIGTHFPWPITKSWMLKWSALVIESAIIQAVVCVPVAGLLALALRRAAAPVAIVLTLIFVLSALFELSLANYPQHEMAFDIFILICHALFLVGGTLLARKRLSRVGRVI